jgi:hypothetical protein
MSPSRAAQLAALVCLVIEERPEAMRACQSLCVLLETMARFLPPQSRVALAETMRDSADQIEYRRVPVRAV